MDWQALCGEKWISSEQALGILQPTDRVFMAGLPGTPFTLCQTLGEKKADLRGLRLNTLTSFFPWNSPNLQEKQDAVDTIPDKDFLKPDAIAETYWHLAHQDPSAWTQEIEVRPFKEKF